MGKMFEDVFVAFKKKLGKSLSEIIAVTEILSRRISDGFICILWLLAQF